MPDAALKRSFGGDDNKLRILMVSDYGYLAGGAEQFIHMLSQELEKQGHEVLIFASKAGRNTVVKEKQIAKEWCFGTISSLRTIVQSGNPLAASKLQNVLRKFKPDIVHLHMFLTQLSPSILKTIRNWPVVYTAHWYRAICMTGFKMLPDNSACLHRAGIACLKQRCVPLRDWLPLTIQMRNLANRKSVISAVVASSETIEARLHLDGFEAGKTILYGIKNIAQRPELSSPPRIGFAARLVHGKGGACLLQAFQKVSKDIPATVLDIFGNGPELGSLQSQAAGLGMAGNVIFHGHLEQDELQRRLGLAWVQAAPSLFEEPGGIVAYEAAMRGTAMVASDHGGFRDSIVHGETGYLVPPGNVSALAEALTDILSDRARAETFGAANRSRGKALFTIERAMQQYQRLYRQLLRSHADNQSRRTAQ